MSVSRRAQPVDMDFFAANHADRRWPILIVHHEGWVLREMCRQLVCARVNIDEHRERVRVEYRHLNSVQRGLRKCLSENCVQLIHDPVLGPRGRIAFEQYVECKLAVKYFPFELLKVEQADCLLLQFIYTGIPSLRSRFEDRNRSRFDRECVVKMRKRASNHDCCGMWVHEISSCPE